MRSKRFFVVTSLIMVMILVAGIVTVSAVEKTTLEEIKERGVIKLAIASWPYCEQDPMSGKYVGIDADLAEMFAEYLGVKLEWVNATWGNFITMILAKKADMSWACGYISQKRLEIVTQSDSIHLLGLVIAVAEDSKFRELSELNREGIVFCQLPEENLIIIVEKNFPKAKVNVISSDKVNAPAMEIMAGRADANLTDPFILIDMVKKGIKLRQLGDTIFSQSVHFFVRREDTDLLFAVNAFIQQSLRDGTMDMLYKKYEIPEGWW